jgi:hypothetical protein
MGAMFSKVHQERNRDIFSINKPIAGLSGGDREVVLKLTEQRASLVLYRLPVDAPKRKGATGAAKAIMSWRRPTPKSDNTVKR